MASFRKLYESIGVLDVRVIDMARSTWDIIGADYLAALGRDDITSDGVIEAVLDADAMLMNGGDDEAYEYLMSLDDDARLELLKKAFPDNMTYGY